MNVTAMTYAKLIAMLAEGTRSLKELQEECGVHKKTMEGYIRALRKEGVIHICMWDDDVRGNNQVAIWMLGRGTDAKKRPKMTHAERSQVFRARKRALEMIGRMAA